MKVIQTFEQSQLNSLNIQELKKKGTFFYDKDKKIALVSLSFFDKLNLFFQRIFCCRSGSKLKLKNFTKISNSKLRPQHTNSLIEHKEVAQTTLVNTSQALQPDLKQRSVVLLAHRVASRFFQPFIEQCREKYGKDGIEVIEDWDASTVRKILADYNFKQLVVAYFLTGRDDVGQVPLAQELDELTEHKCLLIYVKTSMNDLAPDVKPYSYINGKAFQPSWIHNNRPSGMEKNKQLLKEKNLELFKMIADQI